MAGKKHVHKYHSVQTTLRKIWCCALPDCTHYMPPHMNAVLIGKTSYCWECNAEMLLDEDNMKEDMPRCDKCRTPVSNSLIEALERM